MLSISSSNSWFQNPNNIPVMNYVNDLMIKTHNKYIKPSKCFIVPHAGISYSGEVSARMYNYLLDNINQSIYKNINLVIFCTNHYQSDNKLYLPSFRSINLDTRKSLPVNINFINELYKKGNNMKIDLESFKNEHSFTNQIPFLDYIQSKTNKKINIIPIIVGNDNISYNMLRTLINKPSTFVIISTDFNHVGPRFGSVIPSSIKLKEMDLKGIDYLLQKDIKGLSVCGYKSLLLYSRLQNITKDKIELIIRKTSFSDIDKKLWKEQDSIVSYLGIIIKK